MYKRVTFAQQHIKIHSLTLRKNPKTTHEYV